MPNKEILSDAIETKPKRVKSKEKTDIPAPPPIETFTKNISTTP